MFSLFRKKADPSSIAERCFTIYRTATKRIDASDPSGWIGTKRRIAQQELAIIAFASVRSAINGVDDSRSGRMKDACNLFDSRVIGTLPLCISRLDIDSRTHRYFSHLCDHLPQIQAGSPDKFNSTLAHMLAQYLAGANPDTDPCVIGDFFDVAPIQLLAIDIWWASFMATIESLSNMK